MTLIKSKKAGSFGAEAGGMTDKIDTATKVVMQYLAEGQQESAEAYLDCLVKKCKQVSCKALHHSLIHACAKANNPGAALWCAMRMMHCGLKPNIVTFNTLLDASAKTGDIKLATYLWDLMLELGLRPNGITYNTMMNTCVKGDDMKRAEWWLQRMQDEGVSLCPVSFNTVIAALAKNGDFEKAEAWFWRMCEAGVTPDRVIYNSMMSARARAGHFQQAGFWLLEMQRNGIRPDERAYNTMICACAKSGIPERAESWLNQMEQQGYKPDKITLGSLVHAWAKKGDLNRSKHWMEVMAARGHSPNLLMCKRVIQTCQQHTDSEVSSVSSDSTSPPPMVRQQVHQNLCRQSWPDMKLVVPKDTYSHFEPAKVTCSPATVAYDAGIAFPSRGAAKVAYAPEMSICVPPFDGRSTCATSLPDSFVVFESLSL